jgi:hypothetical protein
MSTPESWSLTPREIHARAKVREAYMARLFIEIRNAPHFHRSDKRAWSVDDFLPRAIEERAPVIDELATLKAKTELNFIQTMDQDLIPDWAKGPYKRREKVVPIG